MVRQRTPAEIAGDAIELFLEYRDKHGYDEERARDATLGEFYDGEHYEPDLRSVAAAERAELEPFAVNDEYARTGNPMDY